MLRFLLFVLACVTLHGINALPSEPVDSEDETLFFDDNNLVANMMGESDEFDSEEVLSFSKDLEAQLMSGFTCTLCEDAMKIFHGYLEKPENQAKILSLLEKGCGYLPVFQNECVKLVKEYGKVSIDFAVSYINPTLCKTFHLCTAGLVESYGNNCKVCEFTMGVIGDVLRDPELQTRMEIFTHELCMDYIGNTEKCASMSEGLAAVAVPVMEDFRQSDFLQNACREADICNGQ